MFLRIIREASTKVLLLMPTRFALRREDSMGALGLLEDAATRGVWVRIVSPADPGTGERVATMNRRVLLKGGRPIDFTEAAEARTQRTVTVLTVDGRVSFVVEQRHPTETTFVAAIGTAIYSSSEPTVRASENYFERVREETSLRKSEEAALERERRTRRQAQLLQDILAHDMRNYNQIIRTNAENLEEGLTPAGPEPLAAILRAAKGSAALIDKAVKLSRILGSEGSKVSPVVVEDSITRALQLVSSSNPERSIVLSWPERTRTVVLADELLDEVFVNIFSNAVRYTGSSEVRIEVLVEQPPRSQGVSSSSAGLVRVSVADHGRGIPEAMKATLFTRYQSSASGTGLGLSIVHALVVDRYGGAVRAADRVEGDMSGGTQFQILLKAFDRDPEIGSASPEESSHNH